MKFGRICAAACLAVIGIAGCAGWSRPEIKETFTTHISETGLKSFVYTRKLVRPAREEDGGYRRGGYGVDDYGGGFGGGPRTEERMDETIKAKLEKIGYCREGFLIYRHESDWNYASAYGECREVATQEDRVRFPNSGEGSPSPQPSPRRGEGANRISR